MRPPLSTRRRDKGMTLVELVIAIAILSIGMIAAWRGYEQAQRGIGGQVGRVLAQQVALNRAAELRISGLPEGRGLPHEVAMGPTRWRISLTEGAPRAGLVATTITVSAPDQPGARLVTHLPPGEDP